MTTSARRQIQTGAHAAVMAGMFQAFPDVHVHNAFATTAKWENDQLVEEHVFWDSTLMAQQIGLA